MSYPITYFTAGHASYVSIPALLDAPRILDISVSSINLRTIKDSFYSKISTTIRQRRAMLSLAYSAIGSLLRKDPFPFFILRDADQLLFEFDATNPFVLCLAGACAELEAHLTAHPEVLLSNASPQAQETLLYIACRSGYVDVVDMLLRKGFNVDMPQRLGSTALHAAAFYGHEPVVLRLLACGAKITPKNEYKSTAKDEARTPEIAALIENSQTDVLTSTIITCKEACVHKISFVDRVEYRGEVVSHRLWISHDELPSGRRTFADPVTWVRAWHGTKARHLTSIVATGLRPAGSSVPTSATTIAIPEGHIPLGVTVAGVEDWARAIFVSPSISYSCHGAYAERVLGMTEKDGSRSTWCVVLDVAVRNGDFTSHPSTVVTYHALRREPHNPEMRVGGRGGGDSAVVGDICEPTGPLDESGAAVEGTDVLRVGHHRVPTTTTTALPPVVVLAVCFVRLDFIEKARSSLSYAEVQEMLQTPPNNP